MIGRIAPLAFVVFGAAGAAWAQAGGDPERGVSLFRECSSCHQVGPDATNRVGPHLNHIFDRPAAAEEDYRYSEDMRRAATNGLAWDYETLDTFLEEPRTLVSRTRMSYRGMPDPQDRADLLAYLRQFSDDPANIPEAAPTDVAVDHEVAPEILAIVGDPAYGEYLSSECTACHQTSGGEAGIPIITQWPIEDFVIAMHAYKDGARTHPVMQMMAGRLSNEEIAALAAYFENIGE